MKKIGSKRVWIVVGVVLAVVLAVVLLRRSREHYEAVDEAKLKNRLAQFGKSVHALLLRPPSGAPKVIRDSYDKVKDRAKRIADAWDGGIVLTQTGFTGFRYRKIILTKDRLAQAFPPVSTRSTWGTGVDIQGVRTGILMEVARLDGESAKKDFGDLFGYLYFALQYLGMKVLAPRDFDQRST